MTYIQPGTDMSRSKHAQISIQSPGIGQIASKIRPKFGQMFDKLPLLSSQRELSKYGLARSILLVVNRCVIFLTKNSI